MPREIGGRGNGGNSGLPRKRRGCMSGGEMRLPDPPYVLLDDARPGGAPARLYARPVEIVRADRPDQVPAALARLKAVRGLHAAGYIDYEASAAIEPNAWPVAPRARKPMLWFGLFERFETIAPDEVPAWLPDSGGAWAGGPHPAIAERDYAARFAEVAELIRAGDIYQANLTFRGHVPYAGGPAALYALLRPRARAGYGALIDTGEDMLLSFSPELFFRLDGSRLTTMPMKGTALRGESTQADDALAEALRSDPKQRAENLMIVDLLRNDLSRVARAGSVEVPRLFEVERYPTVHQMVSTVTADLSEGLDAIDALGALFPCGSITGAPKVRAMQVIQQVEATPRHIYTGAIGRIDAGGDAMFNVSIRTLHIARGDAFATLGLGSGVVADSQAHEEWLECLAKGAFVTAGETPFDLIETMRFDPEAGIALLERHLARIKASARVFGFPFDRHAVRNELQAATFRLREAARVRLLLAPSGAIAIGIAPLPESPESATVAIRQLPVAPDDFRLFHKTSRRGFYDQARAEAGSFEVLFTDPDGFLTEGSFTSIFVERDGKLVTPPLRRGLLPGVLRAELIESGRAVEGDLRPEDLRGGLLLGNALRGLVAAVTVAEPEKARV
jgi:para-aminobenzoate synthetase/4-amino-4-deoxychorismate lyase